MFSTAIGDSGMKVAPRSYTGAAERKGPMERASTRNAAAAPLAHIFRAPQTVRTLAPDQSHELEERLDG
jgi:hypothetical protein